MAVVIAARLKNRRLPHLGHAHEGMRCLCRLNRVGGDLDAAIRSVLETYRAREATGQLAVALALGRTRANCAPAHQIADELRRQQIQKLGAHWQAQLQNVQQQAARHREAFVDRKAAIQMRVVDIALPTHGRARLLEVHAHHHQQVAFQRICLLLQKPRVFHRLVMVVDRTRPDDDDEAVVLAMQNLGDRRTAGFHQRLRRIRHRQLLFQERGRNQRTYRANARVVNPGGVVGPKCWSGGGSGAGHTMNFIAACACSAGAGG